MGQHDEDQELATEGQKGVNKNQSHVEDMPAESSSVVIPASIHSFLSNLLRDANLFSGSYHINFGPFMLNITPEDILKAVSGPLIQGLYQQFNDFFFANILVEMSEDQFEQLEKHLDHLNTAQSHTEEQQYQAEYAAFLEASIPYFQEFRDELFFEFRHLYLNGIISAQSEQDVAE